MQLNLIAMKTTTVSNVTKSTIVCVLFFLIALPGWAQGVELTAEQQYQLTHNIERAKEQLELTQEQAEPVEAILRNAMIERLLILDKYGIKPNDPNFQRPDMNTLSKMRDDIDRLNGDIKNQLKSHLSKDQMKTWKKLERERQNQMRARMMGRG